MLLFSPSRAIGCTFACVLTAAVAAGLTVGMLSIDKLSMMLLLETDTAAISDPGERALAEEEQAYAERIWPLIEDHHLLMVTLLLMNSVANEALPIFLDKLVPSPVYAILISVSAFVCHHAVPGLSRKLTPARSPPS